LEALGGAAKAAVAANRIVVAAKSRMDIRMVGGLSPQE
jgi:hypothetical protein